MIALEQRLYLLALRLHPKAFRNQFAEEMAFAFEDALHTYGAARLWLDVLLSLARQWASQLALDTMQPATAPRASLLAGNYIKIGEDRLSAIELARGLVLSTTLLAICGLAPISAGARSAVGGAPSPLPRPNGPSVARTTPQSALEPRNKTMASLAIAQTVPVKTQILHSTNPLPSFEVATIRPYNLVPPPPPPPPSVDGGAGPRPALPSKIAPGRGGAQTTDRVHMIVTAQQLIASAYNLPLGFEGLVEGGPEWIRQGSNRYEVQAKIDDSLFAEMQKLPPSQQRDQVQLMEQSLLADRFKLKVHFQTREMSAFALVVAKGGSKLTPSRDGETPRIAMQDHTMTATAIKLDQWVLAPFLGGRSIVDQTGLKGSYDITLTWSERPVDAQDSGAADVPDLFTAIQQQLGLKLVPTKAPVEFIVIDHIERPSPN